MPQILGQIDRGHSAFSKLILDGVTTFKCRVQTGNWIGHQEDLGSKGYHEGSSDEVHHSVRYAVTASR